MNMDMISNIAIIISIICVPIATIIALLQLITQKNINNIINKSINQKQDGGTKNTQIAGDVK